jgi:hypothetical protein
LNLIALLNIFLLIPKTSLKINSNDNKSSTGSASIFGIILTTVASTYLLQVSTLSKQKTQNPKTNNNYVHTFGGGTNIFPGTDIIILASQAC